MKMPESKTDTEFVVRTVSGREAVVATRGPVWIVDDNPDEAKLSQLALQRLNPRFPTIVFGSGHELVAHLQDMGMSAETAEMSVPGAILLDLKMAEMEGFALMEWLRKQPRFASIAVIVATHFADLAQLKQAYALGARSYLLKPINVEVLRGTLASLSESLCGLRVGFFQSAWRSFLTRIATRVQSVIRSQVPVGYEDEMGFHFGEIDSHNSGLAPAPTEPSRPDGQPPQPLKDRLHS
jgi:CheY-like chemotaxis protein